MDMRTTHRVEVIDELLAAMSRRDRLEVLEVLERCEPSRGEVDAASGLRRLDLALEAARGRPGTVRG